MLHPTWLALGKIIEGYHWPCFKNHMLVELLIVGVILSYLYGAGILDIHSGTSLAIAIALVLTAIAVGTILSQFFAGKLVDSIVGFNSWIPRKEAKTSRLAELEKAGVLADTLPLLERLAREAPRDVEISAKLAEEYLKKGLVEKYIAERTRIAETANLSREAVCSIYNRIADLELHAEHYDQALLYLRAIVTKYPDTSEAANAMKRIEIIVSKPADESSLSPNHE
ncbi:MAG: hypothetical protein K1X53_17310 [Candidatus Sumerlaeaceae bacterium]|nr:hypothetical protein [Candidatus Sumerlaeaceae bacterium]